MLHLTIYADHFAENTNIFFFFLLHGINFRLETVEVFFVIDTLHCGAFAVYMVFDDFSVMGG